MHTLTIYGYLFGKPVWVANGKLYRFNICGDRKRVWRILSWAIKGRK